MREIKFRAWNQNKKVYAFKDFHLLGEVMLFSLLDQYKLEQHTDLLIEQYIGMKDKNGQEIYEGDIVRHDFGAHPVVYYSEVYSFQMNMTPHVYDQETPASPKDIEVIGNVHEHPELLKEDIESLATALCWNTCQNNRCEGPHNCFNIESDEMRDDTIKGAESFLQAMRDPASDVIDAVSKAIFDATPFRDAEGPYESQSEEYKRLCRVYAKAAIEALKKIEPA